MNCTSFPNKHAHQWRNCWHHRPQNAGDPWIWGGKIWCLFFRRAKTQTLTSLDAVSGVPEYVFGRGSALDPAGGAHSAHPDLLAALRAPTCKEWKRREQKKRTEGKGGRLDVRWGQEKKERGALNDFLAEGPKFEVTPLMHTYSSPWQLQCLIRKQEWGYNVSFTDRRSTQQSFHSNCTWCCSNIHYELSEAATET